MKIKSIQSEWQTVILQKQTDLRKHSAAPS